MKTILKSGRWLFASMYAVFGLMHFGPLEFTLDYIPSYLPFPVFWVYFAGVALIAFSVSAWIGILDQLAAVLLALMLFMFVLIIHIPRAMEGDFMGILGVFRDTANVGAALMYADQYAQDKRIISYLTNLSGLEASPRTNSAANL